MIQWVFLGAIKAPRSLGDTREGSKACLVPIYCHCNVPVCVSSLSSTLSPVASVQTLWVVLALSPLCHLNTWILQKTLACKDICSQLLDLCIVWNVLGCVLVFYCCLTENQKTVLKQFMVISHGSISWWSSPGWFLGYFIWLQWDDSFGGSHLNAWWLQE